jgi:Zn-dependent peptidase ImmA (M78 family)/transcriptional regulator with XRE-family HTH domain
MTREMGDRVRQLLEAHGVTLREKDLAREVGMTPDALSRALNGKREFSAIELARVAEHLHTSTHWLITGDPDPRAVSVAARHAFNFDRGVHETPAWDEVRERLSDVALAYQQVLEEVERRPIFEPSWTATRVRSLLVGSHGGDFVMSFAEAVESSLGVDVVRVDGIDRAYSLRVGLQPVIVLRETGNWFYQNWSIAHELGHVISGDLEPIERVDAAESTHEQFANRFAADLLLPRSGLEVHDWRLMTPAALADFVWHAGVSTNALRRRLASLGIEVSARVRSWLSLTTQKLLRQYWIGARDSVDLITERMERASGRRFPVRLIAAHYAAVAAGALHAVTLAWMLGGAPAELEAELAPLAAAEGSNFLDSHAELDWLEEALTSES